MAEPSIVKVGNAEAQQRLVEAERRQQRWRQENMEHTVSWFRRDFYKDRVYRIANPDRRAWNSIIENPDHPFPEVTGWEPIGDGDTRAPSTFVCEGIRYVVRWKWHSGSDRAYWDDGWWPDWYVVVRRRRVWLPLLRKDVEIRVWGAAQVAKAVGS